MTLTELSTIIGRELEFQQLRFGPDSDKCRDKFEVRFPDTNTKRRESGTIFDSVLGHGFGATKQKALAAYAAKLCGKWMVVHPFGVRRPLVGNRDISPGTSSRREFRLPAVITP